MRGLRGKNAICFAGLLAVLAFAFWTGVRGIDFGRHWDEGRLTTSVVRTAETGVPLPGWYNYPSLTYDAALLALAPDLLGSRLHSKPVPRPEAGSLSALAVAAAGKPYLLHARTLLLALSLLGCLWTYLLVARWRGDHLEALLAAALLGSSWELAYQARWLAPDALMMSMATATMAAVVASLKGGARRRWLQCAAVLAGLTASAKYPGAILLLPVLLAAGAQLRDQRALRYALAPARWRWLGWLELASLAGLFLIAFFATTPGALAQPRTFVHDVLFEMAHYSSGHGGYTVAPGIEHARLLLGYLALVAMSPYWPIALVWFVAAVAGAVAIVRENARTAAIFLAVPVLYVAYMTTQRVMIVRNDLVLLPFLAVLGARGVMVLGSVLVRGSRRIALAVVVVAALGAGFVHLETTSQSIVDRHQIDYARQVRSYLDAHPRTIFSISRGVVFLLTEGGFPPNARVGPSDDAQRYLLLSSDIPDLTAWPANHFGRYEVVAGPREVNFDYYPSWGGDAHVVALDYDEARRLGLLR
jgi:hypothetical protein